MSKRTVVDCDACSAKDITLNSLNLKLDRQMDGSGHMETIMEDLDLCIKCLAKALQRFLDGLTYEESTKWYANIKKRS